MVEELICAGLQCFGEHVVNGIYYLLQLIPGVDFSKGSKEKESEQK